MIAAPASRPRPALGALAGVERAFGLELAIGRGTPTPPPGRRTVRLVELEAAELERRWRAAEPEVAVDFRFPDGRPMMRVDRDERLGYRVFAPRFGRYLVAADGGSVVCALPELAPWRWQRLLYAQVLPLAAALQGLDPLHASAVALDGRVAAFVAASGTGKTSVAAHLVALGADLVTDDVLAVEARERVVAHPGPPALALAGRELRAMGAAGRARLGPRVGRAEKTHFAPPVVGGPLPLAGIYFLRREPAAPELRLDPFESPPTRLLLGGSFVSHVRSPERLLVHLETCARLARAVPTFDVAVPSGASARDVAAAVLGQLRA